MEPDLNTIPATYSKFVRNPDWARYQVLAFEVNEETLFQAAVQAYEAEGVDPETRRQLDERNRTSPDLMHVYLDVIPFLCDLSGVKIRFFTSGMRTGKEKTLISFCSNIELPGDQNGEEFAADHLRPEQYLEGMAKVAAVLQSEKPTPTWIVPDQALDIPGSILMPLTRLYREQNTNFTRISAASRKHRVNPDSL